MALAIFRATDPLDPAHQSPDGRASMRFLLALREVDADLHCVMIPDLPGCRAVGRNAQQAILYARRAIDEHCRALALEGEPMPETWPLEHHTPLPDLFAEATWTSVDVPIEQYFAR
jgi:predicted RNase H-like HicB family nuclease